MSFWNQCRSFLLAACLAVAACTTVSDRPSPASVDALAAQAMAATGAQGLAIAVIEDGEVAFANAYGVRNGQSDPLQTDTIMYGASLTKSVFAYMVMQLVEEGEIDLDRSIAEYLPNPLPSYTSEQDEDRYAGWDSLEGDERWRALTPRILLTHSAGFANFGFLEPDGRLRFHFNPGERYAYSGDGLILLQFVLERGLGLDLNAEMQRRLFEPLGMANTSLMWRPDFAANLADGFRADGTIEPHDERSRARASGSMDTTIDDMALFAAAFARGDFLSRAARWEITVSQRPIMTQSQFPTLQAPMAQQPFASLSVGLGIIVLDGPQGRVAFKGGHNDSTGNMMVCIESGRRCVVILSNDVRAEAAFPAIVREVLGETGVPWRWEYGDRAFWPGP